MSARGFSCRYGDDPLETVTIRTAIVPRINGRRARENRPTVARVGGGFARFPHSPDVIDFSTGPRPRLVCSSPSGRSGYATDIRGPHRRRPSSSAVTAAPNDLRHVPLLTVSRITCLKNGVSAWATSPGVWNRRAGSLAIILATRAASSAGTSGRNRAGRRRGRCGPGRCRRASSPGTAAGRSGGNRGCRRGCRCRPGCRRSGRRGSARGR